MSSGNNGDMSNQLKIYTGGDVSEIGVKKIFDDSIRQFETQLNTPVPENADINPDAYNFQHLVRGFGIVISIENFTKVKLGSRPYAQEELQSMYEMLTELEFQVMLFTDLEVQQIKDVLTEAASRKEVHEKADTFACIIGSHGKESNDDNADTFACVIGSHGNESNDDFINVKGKKEKKKRIDNFHHAIYGTDGLVLTKELISLFEDGNCPGLIGKPRMFFLQTCRKRERNISNGYDEGVDVPVVYDNVSDIDCTDSDSGQDIEEIGSPIGENMFGDMKKKRKKIKVYLPFCPNHFYLIYSTSEGKGAFGRNRKGGWMLHAFSTVIKKNRDHEADLLTLSTEACNFGAIHLEAHDKKSERVVKAAITIEHRLTKDIYFRKKKQTSIQSDTCN